MSDSTPEAGPSRSRRPRPPRRLGPLDLLAIVIPLLTVAALALVRPVTDDTSSRPPAEVALTRTTLVCPAALPGAGTVAVASATGRGGEVAVRQPAEDTLTLDGTAREATSRPMVLQAEGDLAAGLVAGRYGDGAATSCDPPSPEQWFTGVGASAEHGSVLELTNPDRGPAVADVTVLGPDGPVDVPAMRGVTVPGRAHRALRPRRRRARPRPTWPCAWWSPAAASAPTSSTSSTSWAGRPQPRLAAAAGRAGHDVVPPRAGRQAGRPGARGRQPRRRRGAGRRCAWSPRRASSRPRGSRS